MRGNSEARIKIPAELFAVAEGSHFDGSIAIPAFTAGYDDLSFDEPLTWSVDVSNTGGAFLVTGDVQGKAQTLCARCLGPAEFNIDGEIEGFFIIAEEGIAPEDADDDEVFELSDDHIIDLEPLIKAAILMEVPNPPLCRDDCAGLCPNCGADLNEGDCGCGKDPALEAFEKAANPFAALADLKLED